MATSGFDQDAQAAQALPPAPLDTIRRRARQRLIGAALLVAAAVIAFPLLFNAEPRPIAVDIPIEIPARETAAPLAVPDAPAAQGAPDAAPPDGSASVQNTPSLPPGSPDEKTAAAQPAPVLPTAPGNTGAPQQAAADIGSSANSTAAAQPAPRPPAARPNTSTSAVPAAKTPPRPVAPPSSGVEVARALLENGNAAQVASLSPKPPARERFVVQVGSFADAARARAVRAQLEMAGLKTFIQEVKGSDGKTTTRVRLGTFNNRGEADRTAARVKALGLLDARVIKL